MFLDGILTSTMDNSKVIIHIFLQNQYVLYIYNFKVIIPIMTFGNQNVAMDKFGMAHVGGEKIVAMAMEKILDLLRHSLMVYFGGPLL